ncbi:MAG: hypothetical protein WC384_20510 [Prolixibacteraceae bacterium]
MKQFIIFQKLYGHHQLTILSCGFNLKTEFPTLKYWVLLFFLSLAISVSARNSKTRHPWQFAISTGIHSYYAPVENLKWGQADFAASLGINKLLGQKQQFAIGLQGQFSQYEFQGDAVGLQLLAQFTPAIFRRFELGLGTGAGYRLSLYSSKPLKWNGDQWEKGNSFKGVIQVPVQISAAYRSVKIGSCDIRPFVAYQLQALFGYSPDLSPLPDSNLMFGLKLHFNKQ